MNRKFILSSVCVMLLAVMPVFAETNESHYYEDAQSARWYDVDGQFMGAASLRYFSNTQKRTQFYTEKKSYGSRTAHQISRIFDDELASNVRFYDSGQYKRKYSRYQNYWQHHE